MDASHLTTDDPTEPDSSLAVSCNAPAPASGEHCILTPSHDVVDSSNVDGWSQYPATVPKRHGIAERGLRARSYPPAGKLPAGIDDWFGLAPLASPETLSESSSLASCGSSGAVAGVGYQRIMSSILPARMDPILQSPARSLNSRDCCLYLESADVVGDLATLSPCVENLPSPLAPQGHHGPDIVPTPDFVIAAPGSSSPDVVPETRSATNAAVPNGSHAAVGDDTFHKSDNSSDERRCRNNHFSLADCLSGCEHEPCSCGKARPDVVSSTHDCRCTAVQDADSVNNGK